MDDITKKIAPEKLQAAVELLRGTVGETEAKKLEAAAKNGDVLRELTRNLSDKDMETVVKVINNPEALKMILSSQKARQGLKNFLK